MQVNHRVRSAHRCQASKQRHNKTLQATLRAPELVILSQNAAFLNLNFIFAPVQSKIKHMERAYQEVIEFIAGGTTPKNVIAFRPSQASKERVETLIERKKTVGLSNDENSELEHYIQLEHLMRLAKARARHHLVA